MQSDLTPGSLAWILWRSLSFRWRRTAVVFLIVSVGTAVYVFTSALGGRWAAPPAGIGLGMPDVLLVQLDCWARDQVRFETEPREEPAEEDYSYECFCTSEPGGPLDRLRRHWDVLEAWPARLVTLQLPWGTANLLSASPECFAAAGLTFVSGEYPDGPGAIAIPEDVAGAAGLGPGSRVPYLVTAPSDPFVREWSHVHSSGSLAVSGIFRQDGFLTTMSWGWLPESFPQDYPDTASAHEPRVLANFEPNAYLVRVWNPGAALGLLEWMRESFFWEDGYTYLGSRYPVRFVWSDTLVQTQLAETVHESVYPSVSGILRLELAFVAAGVFFLNLTTFLERRRELGAYRTVGLEGRAAVFLVAAEPCLSAIPGLAAGLWAGRLLTTTVLGEVIGTSATLIATLTITAVVIVSSASSATVVRVATVIELFRESGIAWLWREDRFSYRYEDEERYRSLGSDLGPPGRR